MPPVPVLAPATSWARKAQLNAVGDVVSIPPLVGLPTDITDRAGDCGGYVATIRWKRYRYDRNQLCQWYATFAPRWAAMRDWCCEPSITYGRPDVVRARQRFTTTEALETWDSYRMTPWAWVPTVQGWAIDDYRRHAASLAPLIEQMARYYAMSSDPSSWRVGIGTLCCRSRNSDIRAIVEAVAAELPVVPLHLWGLKLGALKAAEHLHRQVVSVDSAAWNGRYGQDIEAYHSSGMSQRQHAYTVALPTYLSKINRAQSYEKQSRLEIDAEVSEVVADIPAWHCQSCGNVMNWSVYDSLDAEEKTDLCWFLRLAICPCCQASLPIPAWLDLLEAPDVLP